MLRLSLTLPVFARDDDVAVPGTGDFPVDFDGRGGLLLLRLLLLLRRRRRRRRCCCFLLLLLDLLNLPLLVRRRSRRGHLGQRVHARLPGLKTGELRLGAVRQSYDLSAYNIG